MDITRFEQLIQRLEDKAKRSPLAYNAQVAAIALLGFVLLAFVIGFSLLLILLLGGGLVMAVLKGGSGAIALLLAKAGKAIVILAIPLWVMLKTSARVLFTRIPKPQGLPLSEADAPLLFARLKELRQRMKGPSFHHVLLTNELNAAVVQRPLFGLLNWNRNYLILGMPLLQALSEQEALAVVAHEYGHLAGNHSRFGAFIYRLRATWTQIHETASTWNDWGSRLTGRLFTWYAPYFNAYSFVLARANEYRADRSAAELVGSEWAASALVRTGIVARFEAEDFWPSLFRRVRTEPQPVPGVSREWASALREKLDADRWQRYLEGALKSVTGYSDTHPALAERVQAIGVALSDLERLSLAAPLESSAAQVWLGAKLETFQEALDTQWQNRVSEQWCKRHEHLLKQAKRLEELLAVAALSVDEEWEKICLLDELELEQDLLPLLDALLLREPGQLAAWFRRGSLLLERGDESGIATLEEVMTKDRDAVLPGCEAAYRFYRERNPAKAEAYRQRWEEHARFLAAVQAELENVQPKASLVEADLPETVVAEVTRIVRVNRKGIKRAYLVRRIIRADPQSRAYVLAFELGAAVFLDSAKRRIVKRLAAQEFPLPVLHIVLLGDSGFRAFRKRIKKLPGAALRL